ncbi:hypothetical protein [Flavobacterium sp. GT3R68]|uniref:hypothetical protein n=1 Tax=Flavobacterium sp. GT3R68 TaxID=2594437 RepID=UPI000F889431|nr:hypothetical protein [Flavobacterium sp. GT3R68]RTY90239.1 hypothetical protein EKL32_21460 [Flavobacterium sp. GSN2]TRW90540.1 hypothetical protein FNW07_10965 [Flavobacterium sp. GT3R68]
MKTRIFLILTLLSLANMAAQIGIGTITPRGAMEVFSNNSGVVIPQVALTANNVSAPVVNPQTAGAPIAGTMIYNTATAGAGGTAVTPGFYYWDGTIWLPKSAEPSPDWSITGNAGTVSGTSFIGTTDATDLRIKTNSTDRWNISNANSGQLQAYSLGTALLPVYSFQTDTNTGVFSPSADALSATTAGTERMRITSTGSVGIATTAPSNRLHVVNNADGQGVLRVDNSTAGGFSGIDFYQGASYRGHFGYMLTGGTSSYGGKGAYQLSAGNRPITFSTDATDLYSEKMIIATDGRVGINTNPTNLSTPVQPTSTLQVNGSFAIGIWSIGTTYTLDGDEAKVILTNGATNITITLHDPTTCEGRMISFARDASSTGTVTINPAGSNNIQNLDGTITETTTIPIHSASGGGVNVQFWSNGVNWYR